VHWHDESDDNRHALIATLAGMEVQAICAAVQPSAARRQERARERVLWT
jgi:hypothetical protein